MDATTKAKFNPTAKSQHRAMAKDSSSLATHSYIASAVSNIDDRHITWTWHDVQPRKQHSEVSAEELTLSGFRENLLPQARRSLDWWWEWGKHADSVYTPTAVEYQQWIEQCTAELSEREKILQSVHVQVHGDSETPLLQKTDTATATLTHWRETYRSFSRNDLISKDAGAVTIIRRIVSEYTARKDISETQRRGMRDGTVLAIAAQHWEDGWGQQPTQCEQYVPEQWPGWVKLMKKVELMNKVEPAAAPKSLRKVLERIAETKPCAEPDGPAPPPAPTDDLDQDEQANSMTYRMMPLFDGSASDHRCVQKHLEQTLETLQLKDEANADRTGQYFPYNTESAESYARPLVQHPTAIHRSQLPQVHDDSGGHRDARLTGRWATAGR